VRHPCALLLLSTLVVGAGCYHHPGTFGAYAPYVAGSLVQGAWDQPLSNARRVGCLELWTAPVDSTETAPGDLLVDVRFGNRCDHSVPLDFTRLRLSVPAGRLVFEPWDPRGELHPARVAALTGGEERIEFHGVSPPAYRLGGSTGGSVTVCIEWAEMMAGAELTEPERAPICNQVWR
jgi:hypothetical protein